jgi:hypothetical protein
MSDAPRAKIVQPEMVDGRDAAVIVGRHDIQSALALDEQPTMYLDVVRAAAGGADVTAHTVTVSWDREALEELLRSTDEPEIVFRFDGDDLEAALDDEDVEAHGLRERAAVVAVAATAAAGFAGHAAAQPVDVAGPATAPVIHGMTAKQIWETAPPATRRAAERAMQARTERLRTPAPFHPSTGGGIDVPSPSPATGAIGGAALLVAAAGFAARRHRDPHRFA